MTTSPDRKPFVTWMVWLLCAAGLAALLARPSWPETQRTKRKFPGLDEPAEAPRNSP